MRTRSLAILLAASAVAGAWAQEATGPPFRVDSNTAFASRGPAVAAHDEGFRVVWTSIDRDGSGAGVFARGVGPGAAAPLGDEIQVNEHTTGHQAAPHVAAASDGRFVVVWSGEGPGDPDGVFGRLFDGAGRPAGGQFLVNAATTSPQVRPRVDMAADGSFAVVWLSELLEGGSFEVTARRFDPSGAPLTPDVVAGLSSDDPLGLARAGATVADRNLPGFVITWVDGESVLSLAVTDDGVPGTLTTLSSGQHPFPDPTSRPQAAFDAAGRGWFTWGRQETIENTSTQGRRFDGATLLPEVDLVPVSADLVTSGELSLAGGRGFAVTYTDYQAVPNVELRNRVRVFEPDGTQSGDVAVSLFGGFTEVGDLAHRGASDGASAADFLVVWRQDDAILGRRFVDRIFADGFESGDTSAWSDVVP